MTQSALGQEAKQQLIERFFGKKAGAGATAAIEPWVFHLVSRTVLLGP